MTIIRSHHRTFPVMDAAISSLLSAQDSALSHATQPMTPHIGINSGIMPTSHLSENRPTYGSLSLHKGQNFLRLSNLKIKGKPSKICSHYGTTVANGGGMTLNYDEALDYLYSLINYELKRPDRYTPDVISLERPRQLLARVGNPQETYPIIHVTGTKGKGSVSAMCSSVLQAQGLRVGLYSSPNLQDFRERFRINGELIERDTLASIVERIQPHVAAIPGLTWWEVITTVAFLYFAEAKVDIAVVEVGLGGRLDATNVIHKPLVSVITSLSYDHMYLLGNTLGEIAFEKGGIIKPNCPVVSAPQKDEGREVLENIAAERGSPLTLVGRDFEYTVGAGDVNGQWLTANAPGEPPHRYWTPLLGAHQALNAAVALAALRHVQAAGIEISERALDAGLRAVNWPARMEVVRRSPWLVLDVAHNAESALRLREALTGIFPVLPKGKIVLVFGASSDKDVSGMFRELLPLASHLILTQAMSPRAFSTDQLTELARLSGYEGEIDALPDATDAIHFAQSLVKEPNDLICVTGSLFVVGEMRNVLGLSPARAAYLDEAAVQAMQVNN
jgi:dihydrofolate synthase / folylpolyglutamate synthase